jgi:hypothetical protein
MVQEEVLVILAMLIMHQVLVMVAHLLEGLVIPGELF